MVSLVFKYFQTRLLSYWREKEASLEKQTFKDKNKLDQLLTELRRDDSLEGSTVVGTIAKPPVETQWNCMKKEGKRGKLCFCLLFHCSDRQVSSPL